MRGSELAPLLLVLPLAGLGVVPTAKAELAWRARSSHRVGPVERALSGGMVTLRGPGSTMIRVISSTFVMGSTPDEVLEASASCSREPLGYHCNEHTFASELPRRTLRIASFWLDRTEVTAGNYDRCAARGSCSPRRLEGGARRFSEPNLPATFVSARDAETYCQSRGARLPRESELERAGRGTLGRRYPWGNVYGAKNANHGRLGLDGSDASDGYAELAPVGSFAAGRTPDGFLDLAGNAAEWTGDAYTERHDAPPDPAWGGARAVRGGHYQNGAAWLRSAARSPLGPDEIRPYVGFRCARTAGSPEPAVSAALAQVRP
jgi:formylglycine-generating enzyme required for sulfatase activity